ncbi:MAG: contractile injection system tape measure protein, partial [Thermodesulfobacteriota bacterium]
MKSRHQIGKAVFDFTFSSDGDALSQQGGLGPLVGSRLMKVVDEVFSEFSNSAQVLRFDSLDIDLGDISYDNYEKGVEQKLREALGTVLREKIAGLSSRAFARDGLLTGDHSDFEKLVYFLENGRMPWYADTGEGFKIDRYFGDALKTNRELFVRFLMTTPKREAVIYRLASQFSEAHLDQFISTLSLAHKDFIIDLLYDLKRTLMKCGFIGTSESELLYLLRIGFILELLEGQKLGVAFERTVRRVLSYLFNRLALDREHAFSRLVSSAAELDKKGALSSDLHFIMSVGSPGATLLLSDVARAPEDNDKEKARELIGEWLKEAITLGSAASIGGLWSDALRERPLLLKKLIRHLLGSSELIKRVAEGFPELMLVDIVRLFEPVNGVFIEEVVKSSHLFFQQKIGSPGEESHQRRLFWGFTLTFLLVERGSRFNKKSYMGSVIRQMSANENLVYEDHLRYLFGIFSEFNEQSFFSEK